MTLFIAAAEIGQGSETVLSQVAAEALGLEMRDVTMAACDSLLELGTRNCVATVVRHLTPWEDTREVRRVHDVLEVFADGFDMELDDGVQRILVDELTKWHGMLSGLGDLEPGMEVMVMARQTDLGELVAEVVAGRHH